MWLNILIYIWVDVLLNDSARMHDGLDLLRECDVLADGRRAVHVCVHNWLLDDHLRHLRLDVLLRHRIRNKRAVYRLKGLDYWLNNSLGLDVNS